MHLAKLTPARSTALACVLAPCVLVTQFAVSLGVTAQFVAFVAQVANYFTWALCRVPSGVGVRPNGLNQRPAKIGRVFFCKFG